MADTQGPEAALAAVLERAQVLRDLRNQNKLATVQLQIAAVELTNALAAPETPAEVIEIKRNDLIRLTRDSVITDTMTSTAEGTEEPAQVIYLDDKGRLVAGVIAGGRLGGLQVDVQGPLTGCWPLDEHDQLALAHTTCYAMIVAMRKLDYGESMVRATRVASAYISRFGDNGVQLVQCESLAREFAFLVEVGVDAPLDEQEQADAARLQAEHDAKTAARAASGTPEP